MQTGARLQAAIEILSEIRERGRPASVALADWGRSHRFAGSGDRAWIGNLVYDSLRRKGSLAFLMNCDEPRPVALAALHCSWGLTADDIAVLCSGEEHAPEPLTAAEIAGLESGDLSAAPAHVQGDYPEWLAASFAAAFGARAIEEGKALANRAPVDLRVNTLKATRDKVLKAFDRHNAVETPWSPIGVRLPPREGGARNPNVEADPAHGKGWFEVQDEGSQIAALIADAEPRMQVADLCAGSGGKTLALAAHMQNTGQIYAYDADATRFRPIFERLKRAGARNVQTLQPGETAALDPLAGHMDLVLVDAPCTGTGVWRRKPDAKWRLSPAQLDERVATQSTLLDVAATLVKPGGKLAYVTCSILPEENQHQIEAFLARAPGFAAIDVARRAKDVLGRTVETAYAGEGHGLLLTPASHETDGFFIALLTRTAD
ncbi:Fmu (Sun) domain protein [Rhodomicrobium vannielii ATCC 17100]|uniref:Fmu (Sun) domain protein n=1 Tax=Rhodomicrobium vannielii (strain ATCC 17100 / DSM 162 / LMG 4299 / NCIMB 10020 / ATH 3.1.1) TaxID=648757 RepID=E3HYW7_RHOVT|nr:RsmB/NOP family class I SAM-dependent RNA methyltransferase [Rhodomicrobium vannielii]ADP70942.1 Fmu (Sun) domain protein [Rhodomicrobium vannielii ATCC 17100]